MYSGRLFQLNWNAVPRPAGGMFPLPTRKGPPGVQLSCNKAGAEKAHYKSLSGED